MLNRTLRDSAVGAGRTPHLDHRRRLSLTTNGVHNSADDHLDLFSKSRSALSDDSDVPAKLGRLSLGSARQGKGGSEDLLSSAEGGKHDYDWLLTPPGTPLFTSSDGKESHILTAPRNGPLARSTSTTKAASRLSVSHSENNHSAKPTRSSSATRPSSASSQYSPYSNKSTSILNTSSASISSHVRSSTPTNRSSSITRPSTPSPRPSLSRSTTPSKPRPSMDKPRQPQNSRPSTPTSRQQINPNINSNSTALRTPSRPSTPTRRNPSPSRPSTPTGRSLTNGRTSVSRPSSPGTRVRAPPLPDFTLETPPNLRTSLSERPVSAGRSRPGASLAAKRNVETPPNIRRQPSPVAARGRSAEPIRRDSSARKPAKTSTDNTGFGRTISKKSLDMAIRHMDIRNSSNGIRPLTGSNLFPQSIRSSAQKIQPGGSLSVSRNGAISETGYQFSESGSEEDKYHSSAKLSSADIYESSRYDMILLKEDLKNSNWLHGIDDKSDQESIFDNGFELLPEPFEPL